MGNFNRDRNQGGGRSFGGGGGRFGDRGDRPRPEMHKAICSNCGKPCEVPFKPTGSKPVLCSDCFRASGGPERRPDDRPRFDKPRFEPRRDDRQSSTTPAPQYKEQFDFLNHKLDKILNILMMATEAEMPKKTKEEMVSPTESKQLDVLAPAEKKKKAPKKKVEVPVEEVVAAETVTPEPAVEEPTT